MNFVATSLLIFLALSHSSSREIPRFPDFTVGRNNRPYIPIPAVDEVWRKPIFGRMPFYVPENDFVEFVDDSSPPQNSDSDSQETNDIDYGRKNADDTGINNYANSEEVHDEKVDLNEDVSNDNDRQNKDVNDDVHQDEGRENVNSDEEDKVQDGNDKTLNDGKDEKGSNKVPKAPFFNLKQMTKYLKELERALEQMVKQTMEEAAILNGTYANTTEEQVDVNGQKFLVQKSVIKSGDNNSSIYVEAVDLLPKPEANRTKRSNWYAEKAQKAKESDP